MSQAEIFKSSIINVVQLNNMQAARTSLTEHIRPDNPVVRALPAPPPFTLGPTE